MENIALKNRATLFNIKETVFLESVGDFTRRYCCNGREFLIEKNLNQVLTNLPDEKFIQINSSFIINADYLKRIKMKAIKNAVLIGGIELNIAQNRYWELIRFLKFKYSIW
jgi:DNA-binding LytR/AlgR family response regulator